MDGMIGCCLQQLLRSLDASSTYTLVRAEGTHVRCKGLTNLDSSVQGSRDLDSYTSTLLTTDSDPFTEKIKIMLNLIHYVICTWSAAAVEPSVNPVGFRYSCYQVLTNLIISQRQKSKGGETQLLPESYSQNLITYSTLHTLH